MTNKCIYICFTVKITVNKNNLKKKKSHCFTRNKSD